MGSIKKTGILKKVRKGIGAWKEAVVVIVVVGVVVVVVMEDRDPLKGEYSGRDQADGDPERRTSCWHRCDDGHNPSVGGGS